MLVVVSSDCSRLRHFTCSLAGVLLSHLWTGTYHGCSSRSLVDLVLGGFDLGLQVSRRMEVFALLPRAAALNVVHAHSDCVVVRVDHSAVCRVGEATVVLPTSAVPSLILPTYLEHTDTLRLMYHKHKSTPTLEPHMRRDVNVHFTPHLMK